MIDSGRRGPDAKLLIQLLDSWQLREGGEAPVTDAENSLLGDSKAGRTGYGECFAQPHTRLLDSLLAPLRVGGGQVCERGATLGDQRRGNSRKGLLQNHRSLLWTAEELGAIALVGGKLVEVPGAQESIIGCRRLT
jgi:hypothetical protein